MPQINTEFQQERRSKEVRGFSMIELMIVMVIISVLGSIAIPSYQDYVVRAKVTTLLTQIQPIKLAVTEALLEGGEAKIEKINNQDAAKEISVSGNVITVVADPQKLSLPKDKSLKLTLTPTLDQERIVWKCAVTPGDFKKYVPAECRDG